jgi:dihydroorotate dehydrogenase (fumarate)
MVSQFELQVPIYNAAGCKCTTKEDLNNIASSSAGAIQTKSSTLAKRSGNQPPKYWDNGNISINSNGLENEGYQFYLDYANEYSQSINSSNQKPIILSVAGLSLDDNTKIITDTLKNNSIYALELNLSCPNIGGIPVSSDVEVFNEYLNNIISSTSYNHSAKPIGLKLPVYTTRWHFEKVSHLVNKYDISFITCSNSMPNCLQFEHINNPGEDIMTSKPVILNKLGGGGGGEFMKGIVLGQIYQFRNQLSENVKIVMCGGIGYGMDCYEGQLAGANYFQVGTQYMVEGKSCFDRIISQYNRIRLANQ